MSNEWIDANTTPPAPFVNVLVFCGELKNFSMLVAYYNPKGTAIRYGNIYYWASDLCCEPEIGDVKYWMPLPDVPKDFKNEQIKKGSHE